jgi:antitoxin component YwqK of YwqJK toxin-antitoxin module
MATVEIICPHCNRKQKVAEHRLQETVYCLVCQQLITDVYLYKAAPAAPELNIKLKGRLVSEFGTTKLEDLKSRSDDYTGKFEPVDDEQEEQTGRDETTRLFESGMYAAVPDNRRKALSTAAKTYLIGGAIMLVLAVGVTILGVSMMHGEEANVDTIDTAGAQGMRVERYDNGQKKAEWHVTQVDGEGVPDGIWQEWYETGEQKLSGTYSLGNKVGLWHGWHVNGQPSFQGTYKDGKEVGEWTEWHRTGKKSADGHYVDGNKDGEWRTYYPDGRFKTSEKYDKGKPVGQWVNWYQDGTCQSRGVYKDGLRVGRWVSYHDNGEEDLSEIWVEGALDGDTYGMYRNRQQRFKGKWKAGKRVGEWTWWHRNGDKAKQGAYEDGLKQGKWQEWHTDNVLKSEGSYQAGQRVGQWGWYDEDGNLSIRREYAEGRLGKEQYFFRGTQVQRRTSEYDDGALQTEWTVLVSDGGEIRHGYERSYFPDGSLKARGLYIDGKKQGSWRTWDEVGNLISETKYKDGKPVN